MSQLIQGVAESAERVWEQHTPHLDPGICALLHCVRSQPHTSRCSYTYGLHRILWIYVLNQVLWLVNIVSPRFIV